MVMEAPPTAQCVGREFVRQYYTLLHEAPDHLHRFYNNYSSFVHGGLDSSNRDTKPVIGQVQIHQKIQQLNFRDCHARISQVDSQATLGNGVVVQVTGELSNCGQPMRRFTQTFVLAAQSPKKYYVHNDIFRYQDVILSDEEVEQDSGRSENEDDPEPVSEAIQQPPTMPVPSNVAYYNAANAAVPAPVAAAATTAPVQAPILQHTVPPQQQSVVNGATHPDDVPITEKIKQEVEDDIDNHDQQPPEDEEEIEEELVPEHEDSNTEEKGQLLEIMEDGQQPAEANLSEPRTYATLVKTGPVPNTTSPSSTLKQTTSPPPMVSRNADQRDSLHIQSPVTSGPGSMNQVPRGTRGGRGGSIRGMRSDRGGTGRGTYNDDSGNVGADGDRRRMGLAAGTKMYADNQQIFVGNLPHHATEPEIREIFSKFGSILDLRIHSKYNTKSPSGNRVPNYGFIVFEDPSMVQTVLSNRPIHFGEEQGYKLNVEEKKNRRDQPPGQGLRMSSGGDGGMMGNRNSGGMGQRGGMMRGGVGMGHRGGGRGFNRAGMARGNYNRR